MGGLVPALTRHSALTRLSAELSRRRHAPAQSCPGADRPALTRPGAGSRDDQHDDRPARRRSNAGSHA
ncbi:hypothetical protein APASM_3059 [Actinosynnema pretiosum subsp. pretiosum]|nr:hypothetical protein APASM_3059 [Actinosynnema pretiosum subsp. pretiosum]